MRVGLAAVVSVIFLVTMIGPAHADGDRGFDVSTGGSSGADVEGRVWVRGKSGSAKHHHTISGKSATTFTKQAEENHAPRQDVCEVTAVMLKHDQFKNDPTLRRTHEVDCKSLAAPPPSAPMLGAEAVARLNLPASTPLLGPDPSANRWGMVPVGHPVWLWVEGQPTITTSAGVRGHTVRLTARRTAVTFAMGDGTVLDCPTTTAWTTDVEPGAGSPTCGHTYARTSPTGGYRVAALAEWEVSWSVLGQSGTIPVEKGASRRLSVGEVSAVITRR